MGLLNERRTFQAQSRAVGQCAGGMMMTDDLNAVRASARAMTMMKIEALCLPRFDHFQLTAQAPIVISSDDDGLAGSPKALEQGARFQRRRLIVDEIAQDD